MGTKVIKELTLLWRVFVGFVLSCVLGHLLYVILVNVV